MKARPLERIPVQELLEYGVWEFDLGEECYEPEQDETWLLPTSEIPADDMGCRVAFTKMRLANGMEIVGALYFMDTRNLRSHRQFLGLSVERNGKWFHQARYFDVNYAESGPDALAEFLGLDIPEVFPISYDITGLAVGLPETIRGQIPAEPEERLPDDERRRLLFE